MSELVQLQAHDAVTVVTLNAPARRNALSTEMLNQLIERLTQLAGDEACRAIVLTGAGEHFCAGGDVSPMTRERPMLGSRQRIESAHRVIRLLAGGPKPVVAAVEGFAFGAGLSLAAACDTVVSSRSAKYAAVFTKVGLLPDMGALWSLPQRVGMAQARQLFFTARTVLADEALALGLADQLVDTGEALAAALEMARGYTAAAPLPMAMLKAAYAKGIATLDDALRAEVDVQPALYLTQDHLAAVEAFREKKPAPPFRGV
ncbi:enoyl-CoA hydratase/isomerase family protein [Solimonas soli]|uniref:enoyl-CoA hydratase/isomerase family protein n=1 Tax=Solimonas soli TaxID=413479 RepID=UPI00048841A3|nr:enoyl-CoA hydratase/isomerase family protein [Solimonas soli]